MPLQGGSSDKTRDKNIGELMNAYKNKGKIGSTKPKNNKKAREIATAIAYSKQREKKSVLDDLLGG